MLTQRREASKNMTVKQEQSEPSDKKPDRWTAEFLFWDLVEICRVL